MARFQVNDLQEILPIGYEFVFQPAMMFLEESSGKPELVRRTRNFLEVSIISADYLKLSRDAQDEGDFHQRLCLRVLVQAPAGPVYFMTTHLTLSEGARDRTLAEIGVLSSRNDFPTILVGDFNAGAPEVMNILGRYGFKDIVLDVHPDWSTSEEGFTFNSWEKKKRIDLILYRPSPEVHSLQLQIVGANLFGGEGRHFEGLKPVGGVSDARNTSFASDHLFVEAEFIALQQVIPSIAQRRKESNLPTRTISPNVLY
eukprot:TRINITY_DN277_c0_g1_i5.p2 TRINITY_DN277_c0_g1~~TRINITY_DN277_c0_g1_i5.p2  ORF type:complete len:257 (-),score=67.59 TRINITY_DN277_c0_g1_i5:622-1392(-)